MYTTIALALTLPLAAAMAPAMAPPVVDTPLHCCYSMAGTGDQKYLCRHDSSEAVDEVCPAKSMKTGKDATRKTHFNAGDLMCEVDGARGSVTTCDPHPPQDDGEESGLMESTKPQSLQALGLDEDKAYLKNNMATGLLKRGLRLRSHDETTKLQKFS